MHISVYVFLIKNKFNIYKYSIEWPYRTHCELYVHCALCMCIVYSVYYTLYTYILYRTQCIWMQWYNNVQNTYTLYRRTKIQQQKNTCWTRAILLKNHRPPAQVISRASGVQVDVLVFFILISSVCVCAQGNLCKLENERANLRPELWLSLTWRKDWFRLRLYLRNCTLTIEPTLKENCNLKKREIRCLDCCFLLEHSTNQRISPYRSFLEHKF